MANALGSNPLVCDTAGSISAGPIKVKTMIWTGGDIADGDDLEIGFAAAGKQIFDGEATAADQTLVLTFGDVVMLPSIYLTTIDNGILTIFHG